MIIIISIRITAFAPIKYEGNTANISRSEAGRCFQVYLGCSPIEALIQIRLQAAHAMLRDSDRSLLEICLACGFHSVNYFSRQFRRYYGCSPRHAAILGK